MNSPIVARQGLFAPFTTSLAGIDRSLGQTDEVAGMMPCPLSPAFLPKEIDAIVPVGS